MNPSRSHLISVARGLAAAGGTLGIIAGVIQATLGSNIPDWSGNKDQPVALGLLTVALSGSTLVAAYALRGPLVPRDGVLSAVTLWLYVVAAVCLTTVGRLWLIPGLLLGGAAGTTMATVGWHQFRSVVATNWLRGLIGILGALELLMAVSAAPRFTVAAGLIAGAALIAAAILAQPDRRTLVLGLVAATLPFALLTWWTIVTPVLTAVAFVIAFAATRGDTARVAPLELHPIG